MFLKNNPFLFTPSQLTCCLSTDQYYKFLLCVCVCWEGGWRWRLEGRDLIDFDMQTIKATGE